MKWMLPVVPNVWDQFSSALEKARGVVFDGVVARYHSGISLRRGLEDARCRSLLARNRQAVKHLPRYLEPWYSIGLSEEGSLWLKEITAASERQYSLVDRHSFELGVNWVDADCPLWLMKPEAMLKACLAMWHDIGWTEATLDERLRKTKLRGNRACPIVDVEFDSNRKIKALIVDSAHCPDAPKECTFTVGPTMEVVYVSGVGRARFGRRK